MLLTPLTRNSPKPSECIFAETIDVINETELLEALDVTYSDDTFLVIEFALPDDHTLLERTIQTAHQR